MVGWTNRGAGLRQRPLVQRLAHVSPDVVRRESCARGSVNQTYVEPEVSYNFESGWYVDCDSPMTFD